MKKSTRIVLIIMAVLTGIFALLAADFAIETKLSSIESERFPVTKLLFDEYYASSGCDAFVPTNQQYAGFPDFCQGIFYQKESNTLMQAGNNSESVYFASDEKGIVAFVFFSESNTTGDQIWFKSIDVVGVKDFVPCKQGYYAFAIWNVGEKQLFKFESYEALTEYCTQNSIDLGEWYGLSQDCCLPTDMDSFIAWCRGAWWNVYWKYSHWDKKYKTSGINAPLSAKETEIAKSYESDLLDGYDIIKYNGKLYSGFDKEGRDFSEMWRLCADTPAHKEKALNYFSNTGDVFSSEQPIDVFSEPSLADVFVVCKKMHHEESSLYCNVARISDWPSVRRSAIKEITFCDVGSDKEILKVNDTKTTAFLQKEMLKLSKADPVRTKSIPQKSEVIYDVWLQFDGFSAFFRYGSVFYSDGKWYMHYEYSKIDDCLSCSDMLSNLLTKTVQG